MCLEQVVLEVSMLTQQTSAVRLTHEPTGLVVASQMGKSQHENKDTAFKILKPDYMTKC